MSRLVLFMCILCSGICFAVVPDVITVVREGGITLRSDIDTGSEPIGQVHQFYTYSVEDVRPSYIQIKLKNDRVGWVYANSEKGWTQVEDDVVIIEYEKGLNVRQYPYNASSEIVGYVMPGDRFVILDQLYSHFKVRVPGNQLGWIYLGPQGDRWVDFSGTLSTTTKASMDDLGISDIVLTTASNNTEKKLVQPKQTSDTVLSNDSSVRYPFELLYHSQFEQDAFEGDFNTDFNGDNELLSADLNALTLSKSGSGFVEFMIDLKSDLSSTLVLEHNVVSKKEGDTLVDAYISITVNDQIVSQAMSVSSNGFRSFIMSIDNYLNIGSNSIRIDYLRGSQGLYVVKSIGIY